MELVSRSRRRALVVRSPALAGFVSPRILASPHAPHRATSGAGISAPDRDRAAAAGGTTAEHRALIKATDAEGLLAEAEDAKIVCA